MKTSLPTWTWALTLTSKRRKKRNYKKHLAIERRVCPRYSSTGVIGKLGLISIFHSEKTTFSCSYTRSLLWNVRSYEFKKTYIFTSELFSKRASCLLACWIAVFLLCLLLFCACAWLPDLLGLLILDFFSCLEIVPKSQSICMMYSATIPLVRLLHLWCFGNFLVVVWIPSVFQRAQSLLNIKFTVFSSTSRRQQQTTQLKGRLCCFNPLSVLWHQKKLFRVSLLETVNMHW